MGDYVYKLFSGLGYSAGGLTMGSSTRVWQEVKGNAIFRLQTENENVHHFLSQRQEVKLIAWGVNFNLWIYLGRFDSIRQAQEIMKRAQKEN